MDRLINIDNGGTLTDICVVDGAQVYRTKTLTTPHDLSRCVLDGLKKASKVIYGDEDLHKLLMTTAHIRYSTTQGTNALIERKGPRLGLIVGGALSLDAVKAAAPDADLFETLVAGRTIALDSGLSDSALEVAAVKATNALTSAGANRIVVAYGGPGRTEEEMRVKRVLLRKFPQHLLGAVPVLYSHEILEDDNDVRRTWTALFNAFLHPPMERFLYNVEHKLRDHKAQNPLLIFRNDGDSARVAKTIAVKTYSSGPRGGMEGAKALLDEAGWTDTDGDGVRDKDGMKFSMVYQTSTNAVRQDFQAIIKQWWEELGVEVELKNVDGSVFFGGDPGSPDTFQKFYADVEMYANNFDGTDPESYLAMYTCDKAPKPETQWQGENINRFCDPAYDALIEELGKTGELDKRGEIARKLNDMLTKDSMVIIPLVDRGRLSAHSNTLGGVVLNTWDSELWNAADWYRIK